MMHKPFSALLGALLFCLGSFGVLAQNTIGTLAYEPDLASDGYTLIYPHNQPDVMLLNFCGEVVHRWGNDSLRRPGNVAYLRANGDLIRTSRPAFFGNDAIWAGGGGATIERLTWDGDLLWGVTHNDSTGRLHHDIAPMPNGHVLAIAWERVDSAEAAANGRLPELLEDGELWSERIIEYAPDGNGGAEEVWTWRVWDHLIQDVDSTLLNYGVVADHPDKVDINFGTPQNAAPDWLHINSIDFNPMTGEILLSVPTFDELWILQHGVADEGLKWRWGNPEAHDAGGPEDQKLHYQHDAHWLIEPWLQGAQDAGKIGVFNNSNPSLVGPYSSAHLIDASPDASGNYPTDEATGALLPASFDWTWTQTPPQDFYSSGLSSFQRLPNGNNLLLAGRSGQILEYTPDGDLAWAYTVPLQSGQPATQGDALGVNANLTFRAVRYPGIFPAFADVDLSNGEAIELNPDPLDICSCALSVVLNLETSGPGIADIDVMGGTPDYTFIWYDDTGFAVGNEEDLTGDFPTGTYFVTVTDAAGCSATLSVDFLVSGVEGQADLRPWKVYPNPATDGFFLKGVPANADVQLRNAQGQRVDVVAGQDGWHGFGPNLAPGIYFIQVGLQRQPLLILP